MRAEIEPTWGIALCIWWVWLWRTMLWAVVLGAVLGGIAGVFGHLLGMPPQGIRGVGNLLGVLVGIFVGIRVLKKNVLSYRGKGFRIAILENE